MDCKLNTWPLGYFFWGFDQLDGKKVINGVYSEYATRSNAGDAVEVNLQIIEGRGVLGFTRNFEFLGNISEDLPSPLYPAV